MLIKFTRIHRYFLKGLAGVVCLSFLAAIPIDSSLGEAVPRQDGLAIQIADGSSHGRDSGKHRIKPIKIQRRANLRFGKLGSNGPTGTITINPSTGVKSVSGGVFDFGGIHSRAQFRIRGERNKYVFVSLPGQIPVSVGSGTLMMTVKDFTMNKTNPIFLSSNGRADIYVGATLYVGTSQHRGHYKGPFTVSAEYQ